MAMVFLASWGMAVHPVEHYSTNVEADNQF